MTGLTIEWFTQTTGEDQVNYFNGESSLETSIQEDIELIKGQYRVVDGELFRIVEDLPPQLFQCL